MKTWNQFYPDILPEVPGCPEPALNHALIRTAQDFCTRTHTWKNWLDTITTALDVTEYDIEFEPNSELVRIERATLDGRPIGVTISSALPDDWKTNNAGIPPCILTDDRKTLTLLPKPAAGALLRVEAVLKPSNSASGIEDSLFDNYLEIIAKGAKARLMKMVNVEWSNPAKGIEQDAQFNYDVAKVAIAKMRGFSSAMTRPKYQTY